MEDKKNKKKRDGKKKETLWQQMEREENEVWRKRDAKKPKIVTSSGVRFE